MTNARSRGQWPVAAIVSEAVAEPADKDSRVTPVHPPFEWQQDLLRKWPTESATFGLSEAGEDEFWNTPPRYSETNLQPLAPTPDAVTAWPWRVGAARVLFAMIFCAAVVLLILEVHALVQNGDAPRIDERAFAALGKQSTALP